jgi:hypothetical protein
MFALRRATAIDEAPIAEMIRARSSWMRETGVTGWDGWSSSASVLAAQAADPGFPVWVLARDDGAVMGCTSLFEESPAWFCTKAEPVEQAFYLATTVVHPELAGQRMGAQIAWPVLDLAARTGRKWVRRGATETGFIRYYRDVVRTIDHKGVVFTGMARLAERQPGQGHLVDHGGWSGSVVAFLGDVEGLLADPRHSFRAGSERRVGGLGDGAGDHFVSADTRKYRPDAALGQAGEERRLGFVARVFVGGDGDAASTASGWRQRKLPREANRNVGAETQQGDQFGAAGSLLPVRMSAERGAEPAATAPGGRILLLSQSWPKGWGSGGGTGWLETHRLMRPGIRLRELTQVQAEHGEVHSIHAMQAAGNRLDQVPDVLASLRAENRLLRRHCPEVDDRCVWRAWQLEVSEDLLGTAVAPVQGVHRDLLHDREVDPLSPPLHADNVTPQPPWCRLARSPLPHPRRSPSAPGRQHPVNETAYGQVPIAALEEGLTFTTGGRYHVEPPRYYPPPPRRRGRGAPPGGPGAAWRGRRRRAAGGG